jgi:hypothetical protein
MSARPDCAANSPPLTPPLLLLATILIASEPVRASDVDSEHLFGFTEGADIGKAGEREAESETKRAVLTHFEREQAKVRFNVNF